LVSRIVSEILFPFRNIIEDAILNTVE
jgi:hypothetical protein